MEVLYPRRAGLDVHKDTIVACVRLASVGSVQSEVRTFDTTTPGLLVLADWLNQCGITHVGMEATGIYWKPVWNILSDGDMTIILANAAHVKNVPGRETDVADATWLADLPAHGLIRASIVAEPATREMRALLRTRKQLVREQASHIQRIQKTLEDANIRFASVLTNIMGLSGRAILNALVDGQTDPDHLPKLIDRRVKAPRDKIHAALRGRVTDRHRFLLRLHLRQIDTLDAALTEIDDEVDHDLDPFRDAVRLLRGIPGVDPGRSSARSPPRSRQPLTICCATEPSITTSGRLITRPHRQRPMRNGWSINSRGSGLYVQSLRLTLMPWFLFGAGVSPRPCSGRRASFRASRRLRGPHGPEFPRRMHRKNQRRLPASGPFLWRSWSPRTERRSAYPYRSWGWVSRLSRCSGLMTRGGLLARFAYSAATTIFPRGVIRNTSIDAARHASPLPRNASR
jgi:transposase